jgi:hypothetical protein
MADEGPKAPPKPRPRRPRTRLRRALMALATIAGGLGIGAVVLVGGGLAFLGTPHGNRILADQAESRLRARMTEGDIHIDGLHTDLVHGIELDGVRLTDASGKTVLGAGRIDLRIDLGALLSKRVHIKNATIDGLSVDLTADASGLLDVQRMFGQTEPAPKSDEPWQGLPIDFDVDHLDARGANVLYRTPTSTVEVRGVNLAGKLVGRDKRIDASELVAALTLRQPYTIPAIGTGGFAYTDAGIELHDLRLRTAETKATGNGTIGLVDGTTFDLTLDTGPLDLSIVQRFNPAQKKVHGFVHGPIKLAGPIAATHVTGVLDGDPGTRAGVDLDAVLDLSSSDVPWTGSVVVRDLAVEDVYDIPGKTVRTTGTFTGGGHGTKWPATIEVTGRWVGGATEITQPGKDIVFDSVDSDLALAKGVLAFTSTHTRGPLGGIDADGTIDLVTGDLATQVGGGLVMQSLADLGIDAVAGNARITATVTGNVFALDLPLAAEGRAVVSPFVYGEDVRFRRLEARFRWKMRSMAQHVDVDVSADDGVAYGVGMVRVDAPDVAVAIAPDGVIDVLGHGAVLQQVTRDTSFAAETLTADYTVHLPLDPTKKDIHAGLSIGPHTILQNFPGTGGTVGVRMLGSDVSLDVALVDGDRELVTAVGTWNLDTSRLDFQKLILSPTPRQRWEGQGETTFTLTDGGVADAHIAFASNLGALVILGTVGTSGPLAGSITAKQLQLDAFAELFPEQAGGLSGVLDIAAGLHGTSENPTLHGAIAARNLWLPGFSRWLDVEGEFGTTSTQSLIHADIGEAGQPLARIDGTIPVHMDLADIRLDLDGQVDVKVSLKPGSIARLEELTEQDLGLPEGRISGVLSADGVLRDPDFHLTGVTELAVKGLGDRGRVEFDVDRSGDTLAIATDLREGFESRATIDGTCRTRLGEVIAWALGSGIEPHWDDWTLYADDLNVRVASLGTPIGTVLALADYPLDASGSLLGGALITGSPMTPTITGGLNSPDMRLGPVQLSGAYLALVPTDAGMTLSSDLAFPDGGSLDVNGNIPIVIDLKRERADWVTGDLDLTVGGNGLPVGALAAFTDSVSGGSGLVLIEGHVGGSPFDPQPSLRMSGHDLDIDSAPNGLHIDDGELQASIDPTAVTFDYHGNTEQIENARSFDILDRGFDFNGTDEQGAVERDIVHVNGHADLDGWVPRNVDAHVNFANAYVSYLPDRLIQLNGDVTATGDWPALQIRGNLAMEKGYYAYDATDADESSYRIHDELAIHRGGDVVLATAPPALPPFYSDFDVDIGLDLRRVFEVRAKLPFVTDYGTLGAFVTTANVTARLGSKDLRIGMRNGELALLHEVEVAGGHVGVFRAQFDLADGGTLTFLGDPVNPVLDLTGTMPVPGGGTINLVVQGTAADPELSFKSDEYPDETEIFAILLTGVPPEDIVGGGSQTATLLSTVLGSVLGNVQSYSLQIEPDGRVKYTFPTPSPDIQLTAVFDPFATQDENRVSAGGEWRLIQNVSLEGAYGDQSSYVDLFWEHRF